MTKIQILALKNGENWVNLLTTIIDSESIYRSKKLKLIYTSKINKQELRLWEGYLGPQQTKQITVKILKEKTYYIDNNLISYNISNTPKTIFLSQHLMSNPQYIPSPVWGGCYVEEFWNTDLEQKKIFDKNTMLDSGELCNKLDVNLFTFLDRIGNLILFKKLSDQKIDYQLISDRHFVLGMWMPKTFTPNEYVATLESWKNDEMIEKQICSIKERWTDFTLRESFEFLNLEIFRVSDGQCIYSQKHISFFTDLMISTSVQRPLGNFGDKKHHPIIGWVKQNVSFTSNSKRSLITEIKKERKRKMLRISEAKFNFAFRGEQKEEAFKHLYKELEYMCCDSRTKIVYISDPYFFSGRLEDELYVVLARIFLQYPDITFRLLTHRLDDSLSFNNPSSSHEIFTVKKFHSIEPKLQNVFYKQCSDNSFHDRWICSENREVGISNSLNNFKRGVVFYPTTNYFYSISQSIWDTLEDKEEML
ncbi:MAG TPA: hypothetical protein OIM53_07085 [Sutterellaceae bacterium]|nr:hypothetical protein [Sutterellaceae bacterium]